MTEETKLKTLKEILPCEDEIPRYRLRQAAIEHIKALENNSWIDIFEANKEQRLAIIEWINYFHNIKEEELK